LRAGAVNAKAQRMINGALHDFPRHARRPISAFAQKTMDERAIERGSIVRDQDVFVADFVGIHKTKNPLTLRPAGFAKFQFD